MFGTSELPDFADKERRRRDMFELEDQKERSRKDYIFLGLPAE